MASKYMVKVNSTYFALHTTNRTIFVTFRHKRHAEKTKNMIEHYLYSHKTLPTMAPEKENAIQMKGDVTWIKSLWGLHVQEIDQCVIDVLSTTHSASVLDVFHMDDTDYDQIFNMAFNGNLFGCDFMDLDKTKEFLDSLV